MSHDETEALHGGTAGPADAGTGPGPAPHDDPPAYRHPDQHPPTQATEAIDVTTPPRILGGRYEVGELIGRGGMADVHLGHDNRLGRQVAIKILRSDLARDPNFLMRFRREAQSAAGLNHPSIVAIFDSGEDETTVEGPGGTRTTLPYMVMEYLDGETLRQQLSKRQQFEPGDAIRATESILDALAYSHRMGIVHRDIKPANVMVTATGAIKVMDFGIARAIADTAATMTQTQSVVGTAQYLSPEQAQGQTVDARSDLYSTGCLLFELLAGRPPFVGDSAVAIAYQHVGEFPQPPSVWNEAVGGDLDAVTLHALEKDREVRYQDATAFRVDLENVRLGRPISAAALATGAAVGAAATQTLPPSYAVAGAPTALQPAVVGTDLDEDEESRGSGKRTALIVVLALLMLGLIGWGAATWFGNQTPTVVNVSVPRITGMDEETALSTLRTANLQGQKSTAASTSVAKGDVIAQDPAAGTSGARELDDPLHRVDRARQRFGARRHRVQQERCTEGARGRRLQGVRLRRGEHARPAQGQGHEDRPARQLDGGPGVLDQGLLRHRQRAGARGSRRPGLGGGGSCPRRRRGQPRAPGRRVRQDAGHGARGRP